MKAQKVYSKATTLGPFLTLIVLASSQRGKATSSALRLLCDNAPACGYVPLKPGEGCFSPDSSSSRRPASSGPFLTLILTSGRSQPHAGGK